MTLSGKVGRRVPRSRWDRVGHSQPARWDSSPYQRFMGSLHENGIAHWDPEPLRAKVGRLALRDVFPDSQSQRDWHYLLKFMGRAHCPQRHPALTIPANPGYPCIRKI
jgi:hypothetical protein